jgi:serine protease Do
MNAAPQGRFRQQLIWTVASTALVSNVVGIAIGARLTHPAPFSDTAIAATSSPLAAVPVSVPKPDGQALQRNSADFRAVAKSVGPSVITIKATHEAKAPKAFRRSRGGPGAAPGGDMSELFERFGFSFGMPPGGMGPGGPMEQGPQQASGSGFIIDKNGTIVTNYHVIKGADKITVLLPDDDAEEVVAKVIGTDPRTDLAVLKISTGSDLPAIEWADSDTVEVGDSAIAVGSPFMLTHSVTAGIVSAKGRNASRLIGADFGYELIQTDAAINPGNSGGPLCSAEGKVMGVNTAIYTQSGGYMGIGFAIPSSVAKEVVNTLIHSGKVTRGWLGVAIEPATADIKKEMGIASGVVVHEVQENSPAEKAGLRAGDAITQVGDLKVLKVEQLQKLITKYQPGDKVSLAIVNYTDGKKRTVQVQIGKLPDPKKEEEQS